MEKTERFGFWLTLEEKSLIIKLAEMEGGLSLAALIRRLVREAAQKHGIPIDKFNKAAEKTHETTNG
jgi:hypothetical protein